MPTVDVMPMGVRQAQTNNGMHFENLAGRTVGRVPANLCRAFCHLQDHGYVVGHITARYLGEVGPSINPPTHTRFQGNANGGRDRAGGGRCSVRTT